MIKLASSNNGMHPTANSINFIENVHLLKYVCGSLRLALGAS
jgi:hypothetical protein